MSFRCTRDDWPAFVRRYGDVLRACGVPDAVYRDRRRFFVFLEHGFDEWGRLESQTPFGAGMMTAGQVARLAELVGEQFGEQYRQEVGLWAAGG